MKNRMWMLLALLLACALAPARADYWAEEQGAVACVDGRTSCQVLQMVMLGSFAELNLEDSLGTRVLSAVLPMLCGVTERDFEHFCAYFGEDEATVKRLYYVALGNCLLADMQYDHPESEMKTAARRVLRLFLAPEDEPDAQHQMDEIRAQLDAQSVALIATQAGVPEGFVAHVMGFGADAAEVLTSPAVIDDEHVELLPAA